MLQGGLYRFLLDKGNAFALPFNYAPFPGQENQYDELIISN
jgi:hypothetical protein